MAHHGLIGDAVVQPAHGHDQGRKGNSGLLKELTLFFRKTLAGDDTKSIRELVRGAFRKRLVGDEGASIRKTMWRTFNR